MYEEYDLTVFEALPLLPAFLVAFADFLKEVRWRYSNQGEILKVFLVVFPSYFGRSFYTKKIRNKRENKYWGTRLLLKQSVSSQQKQPLLTSETMNWIREPFHVWFRTLIWICLSDINTRAQIFSKGFSLRISFVFQAECFNTKKIRNKTENNDENTRRHSFRYSSYFFLINSLSFFSLRFPSYFGRSVLYDENTNKGENNDENTRKHSFRHSSDFFRFTLKSEIPPVSFLFVFITSMEYEGNTNVQETPVPESEVLRLLRIRIKYGTCCRHSRRVEEGEESWGGRGRPF